MVVVPPLLVPFLTVVLLATLVLALGCNLGPRRETLEWACRLLERAGVDGQPFIDR